MSEPRPTVVILAGPNGAGKSTVASALLLEALAVDEFVNADVIARGLSAFDPDRVAITAGRIMLARLHELAAQRADFAFETTLASRSFAPWLRGLRMSGYDLHLFFLWVPTVDVSISRVKDRVFRGGHNVPETDLRRRYERSIRNFLQHYRHLADSWQLFDNSITPPLLIARKDAGELSIMNKEYYELLIDQFGND